MILKWKNLNQNMQKQLRLAILLNSSYKKPIFVLAVILYDLSKNNFCSETISKNAKKLQSSIIYKSCKTYTENDIAKKIMQAKLNNFKKFLMILQKAISSLN